jgi:hypothetical protein
MCSTDVRVYVFTLIKIQVEVFWVVGEDGSSSVL